MAWTTADIVLVETAIKAAAQGKTVSFGGKVYTTQDIPVLMQLRQTMQAEVDAANGDDSNGISFTPTVRGN